jgi:diphosphomevalonate decarboxylase
MKIQVSSPSNIALIKYMGKIPDQGNKPTNSSLSYTLEHLRTFVDVTLKTELTEDEWKPLKGFDLVAPELTQKPQE